MFDTHALFISDVHLGSRFSRVDAVLRLLNQYHPKTLYLVGDILDARVLQRRWYWPPSYNAFLNRVAELSNSGTRVCYTPGNHDSFLRDVRLAPGPLEIEDSFVHQCLDGRRLLVQHGDQFDQVERGSPWLSHFGSLMYEQIIQADRTLNRSLSHFRMQEIRVSRFVKQSTKRVVQRISGYFPQVIDCVNQQGLDGIVCGHIHVPEQRIIGNDLLYLNTGDWVENATGAVESNDGKVMIVDLAQTQRDPSLANSTKQQPALSPLAARFASEFLSGWLATP